MMLTSKPIKEAAAKKLGLVDEVVPPAQLLEAARTLALDMAGGQVDGFTPGPQPSVGRAWRRVLRADGSAGGQ